MRLRLKSVFALGLFCLPAWAGAFNIPFFWLAHASRSNPNDPLSPSYVAPTATATPWLKVGTPSFEPTSVSDGDSGDSTSTATATPSESATPSATPSQAATTTPTQSVTATPTPTTTPTPGQLLLQLKTPTCVAVAAPAGVVAGNNAFTVALFNQVVSSSSPGSNVTLSPFSVATDLSMAYQGAAGANATQMAGVLGYPSAATSAQQTQALLASLSETSAASGITLTVADGLWMNNLYSFVAATESLLTSDYGAAEQSESYANPTAIVDQINDWVDGETQGMIPSIISPSQVSATSVFDLVNAVYFDAKWASQFTETFSGPFAAAGGATVTAQYMNQVAPYPYFQDSQVQVVELPYVGGTYGMVVVLPQPGVSLGALEASLTASQLLGWVNGVCPEMVNLSIPTLSLQTGPVSLIPEMQNLGMTDAFQASSGNFSGLVSGSVGIDVLNHAAKVIVNQQGTQAAAATVMGGYPEFVQSYQATFDANAPFLWFILDQTTGSILFISQVDNPNNQ